MRRFVLAAAVIEALIYFALLGWLWRAPKPVPPYMIDAVNGFTFFFFFLVLPAFVLAWRGVWVGFALGLVCFTAFMWLSVYVGGQISNY